MKKKVGFIGLGVMGKPMAKNLLKASFPLLVYDIREEPIRELTKSGAAAAKSPQEVAQASDIVIVMVADASQVQDVVLGAKGVAKGIKEGNTLVIMSTIEPTVVRSIADTLSKKGVNVIDAPVYRGAPAAEAGTLGILVGGDKQVMEDCREILQSMGKDVFYCGGIGNGEIVKIVNNYIIINTTLLISEGVVTGVKYGIEPERLIELLLAGSANSFILNYWSNMVLNRNFSPPLFNFDMALKDTGLCLNTAKELKVPTPIGALCHQIFRVAGAHGRNKLDYTAAVTWLEELTDVEIVKKKRLSSPPKGYAGHSPIRPAYPTLNLLDKSLGTLFNTKFRRNVGQLIETLPYSGDNYNPELNTPTKLHRKQSPSFLSFHLLG